jgi:hypothetical protein
MEVLRSVQYSLVRRGRYVWKEALTHFKRLRNEKDASFHGMKVNHGLHAGVLDSRHVVRELLCPHKRDFIHPKGKLRYVLRRLSRNSNMLNTIMCKSLVPNFTQIGQLMWKVCIKIYLHPAVIYGFC